VAKKKAAGILLFRLGDSGLEVFLVHPGGPFWKKKDAGAWSIPKGELEENEDPLNAAKREFNEETGVSVDGDFVFLTPVKQPGGKLVYAWAMEGDCDPKSIKSNMFSLEWPPRSGKREEFPEVDRAGWFTLEVAKDKILKGQVGLLDELRRMAESNKVRNSEHGQPGK
jgi:predicted NUDIX family NTP pyrophosphohydrolase